MMFNPLHNRLPDVLKPFKEYQNIMETENQETNNLTEKIKQALNNSFFLLADEKNIEKYEEMLNIIPKSDQTLEERRFGILVKYQESRPFTFTLLQQQLDVLCNKDYWLEIHPERYFIKIMLALKTKHTITAVKEMVARMLPANMVSEITLKYNQHKTFKPKTHEELKAYRHLELRNEVLS